MKPGQLLLNLPGRAGRDSVLGASRARSVCRCMQFFRVMWIPTLAVAAEPTLLKLSTVSPFNQRRSMRSTSGNLCL